MYFTDLLITFLSIWRRYHKGACIRKRVVYDILCKCFQFFVNLEALMKTSERMCWNLESNLRTAKHKPRCTTNCANQALASWYLGESASFDCGTYRAFHITILLCTYNFL